MVEKRQFAKAFQQLDKTFSSASVYFDFHRENLEKEFAITEAEIESYYGKYVNVLEELRADNHENDDEEDDPIDIEYMLRTHSIEEINYRYILSLIQQFLPKDKKKAFSGVEKNKEHKEIDNYIAILEKENPELSILMHSLWKIVEQNPEVYRGKNITELLEQKIGERTTDLVNDFAKKMGD